jgi:hypothetical protein
VTASSIVITNIKAMKEPQMERQIVIPTWAHTGVINLGVDFGTHSTKAILRIRNSPNKALVLFLDEPYPEYPHFAAPSLIRLSGGKLFFGQRALREPGELFNSLKVSLLPPPPVGGWDEGDFPLGTTPDLLVALYLSWILGRIKAAVGEGRAARLTLNVAAPMDHVENQALKERYLHVIHAAWQATIENLAPPVAQGAELACVGPAFKKLLEKPVPDLQHRRFEVLPETLAPLASLFHDPKTRDGLYMVADMGAGTTELSVSRVAEPGDAGAMICYSDKSVWIGGDQFRSNDVKNAGNNRTHWLEEERLKSELRRELACVWYAGFTKEKDGGRTAKHSWKQLTVVLAGGGLRRAGIQEVIKAFPPLKFIFMIDPIDYMVNWHTPAGLDFGGGQPGLVLRDPMDSPAYLAVAHGLSLERQRWPKFYYPGEVEPLTSEPRVENPYERSYSQSDVG